MSSIKHAVGMWQGAGKVNGDSSVVDDPTC